jgi:hypothetical protein
MDKSFAKQFDSHYINLNRYVKEQSLSFSQQKQEQKFQLGL